MNYFAFAIAGSALTGFGFVLQRLGLAQRPPIHVSTFARRFHRVWISLLSSPRWTLGVVLSVFGWSLYFQALRIGDLSVVHPLYGLGIAVTIAIACAKLGEYRGISEGVGISLMIGGAMLLGLNSKITKSGTIRLLPLQTLTTILFSAACILAVFGGERRLNSEVSLAASAGVLYGLKTVYTSVAAFQTKEAVITDVSSWQAAATNYYFIMILFFAAIAFCVGTSALSHGRASVVNPVTDASNICVTVAAASLLFGEQLWGFTLTSNLKILGILLIIAGSILIKRKAKLSNPIPSHSPLSPL